MKLSFGAVSVDTPSTHGQADGVITIPLQLTGISNTALVVPIAAGVTAALHGLTLWGAVGVILTLVEEIGAQQHGQ